MNFIADEALLQKLLRQERILDHFETPGLGFRLVRYEKHELLCAPGRPLDNLLFVAEGSVQVYGLREDGGTVSISRGVGKTTLGTMEFARRGLRVFYTEALEDVLAVALPIEPNRALLERDRAFLRFVVDSMAEMVIMFTLIGTGEQSVEETLLTFLRDIQPDHTLHSVNGGLRQIHCSRRQLQRVLKKLCEDGVLEKIGKGKYRLAEL